MSGIKDLAILIHWMDNSKQSTLEASFFKKRKVPRERQLILNELHAQANQAGSPAKKSLGIARLTSEKRSR